MLVVHANLTCVRARFEPRPHQDDSLSLFLRFLSFSLHPFFSATIFAVTNCWSHHFRLTERKLNLSLKQRFSSPIP